jgi:competence protein ComFC
MILGRLMEVIAPASCVGCGVIGDVVCTTCFSEISLDVREVCVGCGRNSREGRTCDACSARTKLTGVSVGAFYEGSVKEAILQLKFHRLRSAGRVAAELLARRLPRDLPVDVVTSVPVAPERYRERGYNQSELVARLVAPRLGLPYRTMLGRVTSVHQMGLDRQRRLNQIAGVFFALRDVRGARVLVVDDVVTTGATLSECASTLSAAGAQLVWGAAVARH